MRHLLLAAALAAASAPARAQIMGESGWMKKLIEIAKDMAAAAPAPVDKKPIDALFDKVVREGSDTATDAGPAVAVEGVSIPFVAGEDLVVGAFLAPNEGSEDSTKAGYRDLVYRRTFRGLFAVRRVTTDAGDGFKRLESWSYRLGFEGVLYPVLHAVVVYKPLTGQKAAIDLTRSSSEKIPARDAAAQKGWKDLAPRLLTVQRVIEV